MVVAATRRLLGEGRGGRDDWETTGRGGFSPSHSSRHPVVQLSDAAEFAPVFGMFDAAGVDLEAAATGAFDAIALYEGIVALPPGPDTFFCLGWTRGTGINRTCGFWFLHKSGLPLAPPKRT